MSSNRVAKNTAYLIAAFVGQKVLTFVYFTIVARTVGVDGAGKYFLAISLPTMFSIFVDLGLANVLVREVAKYPDKARVFLGNVLGLKMILAVLTIIATLVTAHILDYQSETKLMISIACAVMVLDSIHLVLYAVMRGFQNLRYEAIGVISGQALIIISGSFFMLAGFPLYFLVVALLCGSAWNVIWSCFALMSKFGIWPSFLLNKQIIKFFWGVTIPFALAGIFSRVYSYIDSIMLSKFISESIVGIYGVAYKIAFSFQFIPMAFAAALYPAMSENYVKNREKLSHLLTIATVYLLLVAVPLAVGLAIVARPLILLIYGEDFAGSVLPLQILMFSLVFAFLYWPAGSLLNAADRQAKNTLSMGITMVLNIVLNAILIPRFGPVGAAVAALAGNFVLWGSALYFSRTITHLNYRRVLTVILKTSFSAGAMVSIIFILGNVLHLALLIPLGALVYVSVLILIGGLTWSEIRQISGLFLKRGQGVSDLVP
jgi:O-antigen/teichoic acid export membrane protein